MFHPLEEQDMWVSGSKVNLSLPDTQIALALDS